MKIIIDTKKSKISSISKILRIIVDLDVATTAMWDQSDKASIANNLLNRIKSKEINAITPRFLLDLLIKWDYSLLVGEITDFYEKYTKILTNKDVDEKIGKLKIDDEQVLKEIRQHNIKDEDALLVLVASIFEVDYLITFNRKHLLNKKDEINEVLKKNGLKSIKIIEPSEVP